MEGYMATILFFGGNFAPKNWAFCNGQVISISSNTALFSLLGTTYGGDGRTTFALPDFRGRVPVGMGNGPGLPGIDLGQPAGSPTVTLTVNQMPAHTHGATAAVAAASTNGSSAAPTGNIFAASSANAYGPTSNANAAGTGLTLASAGGSQPFSIQQPTLCVSFIICMYGIYPARN